MNIIIFQGDEKRLVMLQNSFIWARIPTDMTNRRTLDIRINFNPTLLYYQHPR